MINTIFFDLGNVLVNVDKSLAFKKIAEITGLDIRTITEVANSSLEKDFEKGKYSIDEYINLLREKYRMPKTVTLEKLVKIWEISFNLNKPVLNLLTKLKGKAKIFLLSNTDAIHIRAIEGKYDILRNLDGAVLSFEVGYCKPEPEIYHKALKQSNTSCENSLLIDDLEENVLGAEKVGIKGFKFTECDKLKTFLQSEGFQI